MPSPNSAPHINYLYIEIEAADYPLTRHIREVYSDMPHIMIDHYADLFNRPRQVFHIQKQMPSLILAVAHKQMLYRGAERLGGFGDRPLYYTDQLRNCPFNCRYCFLQGMHRSAHLLLFVNSEAFEHAVSRQLVAEPTMHLSVSYLSDLLGFECTAPLCAQWVAFAANYPRMLLEIRTKSNNIHALHNVAARDNVRLVWSLTPHVFAQRYEHGTASLPNRLLAARQAVEQGWRINLSLDPIILITDWRRLYEELIAEIFHRIPHAGIDAVSYGVFRMHPDYFKKMQKEQPDNIFLAHPYQRNSGLVAPDSALVEEVRDTIAQLLGRYISVERIFFAHG